MGFSPKNDPPEKKSEMIPKIWEEKQDHIQKLFRQHHEKKSPETKDNKQAFVESQQSNWNIADRFQALIEESETVYEIISPEGIITFISDAATKVVHYQPDKLIGEKIFKFYQDEDLKKLKGMISYVLANPGAKTQNILTYKKKTGERVHLEVNMRNLISHPAIEGIILSFTNATTRVKAENKLNYTITHDELTGLPNRLHFKTLLAEQYALSQKNGISLAVLMLDFERIKYISDALGTQFGDQMIMKIMIRLKAFLKKNQIIGRYSENQFGIIAKNLASREAYATMAREITALFSQPFKAANYEFEIAMSMGISLYTEDTQGKDPDDLADESGEFLIKQANIALLWAKKEGPNKFKFYCTDFSIQNYKQFELRSDFIKAIYQSQFEIFYQPIVTLKETKILVAEALIRWNHPVWGLVSPGEFIYLSEETGSIIEMEKWMLNEVCQSCNKILNEGFPKQNVMVNFSSIQFYEKSFALTIKEILAKFSLDPKFLIVKVTEDLLLDDSENIRNNLKELRSMGIKIALNDPNFSFIGLQNFNIDILILDGSFLNSVLTVTASASIVQSIIELTRQLNIKLVAVGIDNWEQKAFLEKLNCYAGQGDFYSKPLPKEEFKTILETGISDPEPLLPQNTYAQLVDERRNYFRLFFNRYVRADLAILQIKDKQMGVGNTKVLIQDIGPGGLCFISNIQFPIEQGFTLQFETSLLNKKIKVYGNPMHMKKFNNHLYQYGVKFSINEDERDELTKILFEIQTIVKRNTIFEDSSFTFDSPSVYFKGLANQ